jgi:hypothetical protein
MYRPYFRHPAYLLRERADGNADTHRNAQAATPFHHLTEV